MLRVQAVALAILVPEMFDVKIAPLASQIAARLWPMVDTAEHHRVLRTMLTPKIAIGTTRRLTAFAWTCPPPGHKGFPVGSFILLLPKGVNQPLYQLNVSAPTLRGSFGMSREPRTRLVLWGSQGSF
jgi:hypothetical protein